MAIRLWKTRENAVKSFTQSKRIILLMYLYVWCVLCVISKSSLEIWMTFDLLADCKMVMVNFLNNEPLNSYLPSPYSSFLKILLAQNSLKIWKRGQFEEVLQQQCTIFPFSEQFLGPIVHFIEGRSPSRKCSVKALVI